MEADEVLYQRVQGGDMAAFDVLYERHERRLFRYLLRLSRSRADAEDLFHEAFLSVLRSPEVRFDRASFSTWLFRVAHNLCLNHLRSARRADQAHAQVASAPPLEAATPESLCGESALSQALAQALARLPAPLLELYHLRVAGLSYEEMAELLQVPLGTVKSRMNQMMNQLRLDVSPWTA